MMKHPPFLVRSLSCGCGVILVALAAACATAPPPAAPVIPFEQKMTWVLRLEDRRILREEPPPVRIS
jgi:hypothetical protein